MLNTAPASHLIKLAILASAGICSLVAAQPAVQPAAPAAPESAATEFQRQQARERALREQIAPTRDLPTKP